MSSTIEIRRNGDNKVGQMALTPKKRHESLYSRPQHVMKKFERAESELKQLRSASLNVASKTQVSKENIGRQSDLMIKILDSAKNSRQRIQSTSNFSFKVNSS